MAALSALFIGGNGIISSASSALAVAQGIDLTLLNRGTDTTRPPIDGARHITGSADDLAGAIGDRSFDVVVNFRSFSPSSAAADAALLAGRVGQYVYISSASAYHKPVTRLPITESMPLHNPFWEYSRNKAASERVLNDAYNDHGFPVTIVRPSHTYDRTLIPLDGGWTVIDRMRRGLPTIVHGDGTSLWTLTHNTDFAVGLVGLLGHPAAIGDTFHITSDEALPWNEIATTLAAAAGASPELLHVTSDDLAREVPEWGDGLLGDKAHSVVFDNSKIRRLVPAFSPAIPFWKGAREIVDWFDASAERRVVDAALDARLDAVVAAHAR